MKHETSGFSPEPQNRAGDTSLFEQGLSLDGRVPRFQLQEVIYAPLRKRGMDIYELTSKQYVEQYSQRIVSEFPQRDPLHEAFIYAPGVSGFDITRDLENDAITNFNLTLRSQVDIATITQLQDHAMKLQSTDYQDLSLYEIIDSLLPTCQLDAKDGVSIFQGADFIVGFGPSFGKSRVEYGDPFLERLEWGLATPFDLSTSPLQLDYCISMDLEEGFYLQGGLLIQHQTFDEVKKDVIAKCHNGIPPTNIFSVVEPYYQIITVDEMSQGGFEF